MRTNDRGTLLTRRRAQERGRAGAGDPAENETSGEVLGLWRNEAEAREPRRVNPSIDE
jgi:hypothetical protein